MKKSATNFFFILLVTLGLVGNTFAQAPEGIIYQAEARDKNGNPIRNQTLDVLIKIIQDDASGQVVWEGLHEVTTSNFGIFVLVIGHGTNNGVYVFEDIEWGNHAHFLNVKVKKKNTSTWIDMGTQRLLSVPYALHSKTAETVNTETDPLFTAWDKTTGILITESQISDLGSYLETETDPAVSANFDFTNAANGDLLQFDGTKWVKVTPDYISDYTVTETDVTTHQGALAITESQISDLEHFTTADETDPSVPSGTQTGEMQYWNGSAWVTVAPGIEGQVLTFFGGVPIWKGKTTVEVVDVENPTTGKTWMDRNLGASQMATSSTDANAYGDLYQWGRVTDGHEKRTSGTTATLSTGDTPGHGNFIINDSSPYDWRSLQNDNLWQGVNGTNNPCPSGGYRLPTEAEWHAEILSWSMKDAIGAFASPLKLPMAGSRRSRDGLLFQVGSYGLYWTSTVHGTYLRYLEFEAFAVVYIISRAYGLSVRCLKD